MDVKRIVLIGLGIAALLIVAATLFVALTQEAQTTGELSLRGAPTLLAIGAR